MREYEMCLNCRRMKCPGECDAVNGTPRTRKGRCYTAFGETADLRYFVEKYGIPKTTLYQRVNRYGMTMEEAIMRGKYEKPTYEAFGQKKTMREWARKYGIDLNTLRGRVLYMGMSLEEALTAPLKHSQTRRAGR